MLGPCIGDMLVTKSAKICSTPKQILQFVLLPTQNPNAGQWNISCVGFSCFGAHLGHVHFMFFVSISFALGPNANTFSVEYGLKNMQTLINASKFSLAKDDGLHLGLDNER